MLVTGNVPAPHAYFHLEGFVANELVDEIAGRNFTKGTVAGTFAAGVSGNGWSGAGIPAGQPSFSNDTFYNINGVVIGFTLRLWFKMVAFGVTDPQYPIYTGAGFRVYVDWMGNVTFSLKRQASVWVDATQTLPSAGAWHHVMCYWDRVGNKIGIKINDAAATETAFTWSPETPALPHSMGTMYQLGAGGPIGAFDELAFWKDTLLSASEMTADYNAGIGLFWPW